MPLSEINDAVNDGTVFAAHWTVNASAAIQSEAVLMGWGQGGAMPPPVRGLAHQMKFLVSIFEQMG